jgi:TetR/AcrR family transcriptional regulator, transcriptional repressor for nem operon
MPRNKSYNENEVLERAMNVFWINGYEATSVRLLEKEMGINQFSIYSSFSSKKKLFIESIRSYREHVKQNVYQTLLREDAGMKELEDYLYKTANKKRKAGISRGCLVVNTAAELGSSDEGIAAEVNGYFNFIREMLGKVLKTAVAKGEISPDTDIEKQSAFFLGVMQGLSVASRTADTGQLNDFVSVALKQIKFKYSDTGSPSERGGYCRQ